MTTNETTTKFSGEFGTLAGAVKLTKRDRGTLRRMWQHLPIARDGAAHVLRDRWHGTPMPIEFWQRIGVEYTPCAQPNGERLAAFGIAAQPQPMASKSARRAARRAAATAAATAADDVAADDVAAVPHDGDDHGDTAVSADTTLNA